MPAPAETPTTPASPARAADIAAGLRAHADAGADHAIVALEPSTPAAVERFAEAVELFRAG